MASRKPTEVITAEAPRTRKRSRSPAYAVTFRFLVLAPLLTLIAAVIYGSSLRDGVVVLTGAACPMLAYHGAKFERLEGGALCAIRAPSCFGDEGTTGRILIRTEIGEIKVRLLRSGGGQYDLLIGWCGLRRQLPARSSVRKGGRLGSVLYETTMATLIVLDDLRPAPAAL